MGAPDPLLPLATALLHAGPEPERALVVGCGDGDGALLLAREFPRSRVRGVDDSEAAVARAAGRVGLDPEGRIAFKVGGRRRLPFPDAHFDLIAQAAGRPAVAELARVLRPGGRLVLAAEPGGRRLPGRWSARRLAGRGFEKLVEGEAGGGSFCVMALRAPLSR